MHRVLILLLAVSLLVQCAPTSGSLYMPAEFCYVDEVALGVRADLKYAGHDNFVGRPISGYEGQRPLLRRDAAQALARAAEALRRRGYGLLVWDAYRPSRALLDFRAWSRTADDHTKAEFYPRITKQEIYDGRYIGDTSEHTWGIAVDLTLVHLPSGTPVDMGGRHDLLDTSSATYSQEVTPEQQAHRRLLHDAMLAAGFENYTKEWWHYRLANSKPWRVYNFPVRDDLQRLPAPSPGRQGSSAP